MFDQSDAYHYRNYISDLAGARLNIGPNPVLYRPRKPCPYLVPSAMVEAWKTGVKSQYTETDLNAMFSQKADMAEDRIDLILGELDTRDRLKYENLGRLYSDLLRVSSWRRELPFPDRYQRGRTWTQLNQMELSLRDQIRRELKDSVRDTAFPGKDLRESLLEFKLQNQKSQLLGGLDEVIEPTEDDMHYSQT